MKTHPTEISKYLIIKHLGSGQFGDVYLATDRALDTNKAIKVLDVHNPHDFMTKLEEAQILNKCKHKHIVKINDANLYDVNGELKVVIDMEYIKGGSLEKRMKREHISTVDAIGLVIDILFALEYSHQQGILHRDVKPANIMLAESSAKLSDFGLATAVDSLSTGSPKGYTTHLAPEFFVSLATTELTDIFAVGVTLFRIANNMNDWRAKVASINDVDNKIHNGSLISSIGYLPYIPQKLKRVINKACNPESSKRYQSALELRQALEKITPLIKWKRTNVNQWSGICCRSGVEHGVSLSKKRSGIDVIVKKNNRRMRKECKSFVYEKEALDYFNKHVATTAML